MRFLRCWKYVLAGLAGLAAGIILFAPWDSLADYAVARGLARAAENGIYGVVREVGTEGLIDKEFVCRGLQLDFPVFRVAADDMSVNPAVLHALFTGRPEASVTFGRGELVPVTRQKLEWNSGSASVSVRNGVVSLSDIEFTGKFSARGFLDFSTETNRITRANLTVKVPEDMDRALQMLGGSGMLPISKVRAGEWKVER